MRSCRRSAHTQGRQKAHRCKGWLPTVRAGGYPHSGHGLRIFPSTLVWVYVILLLLEPPFLDTTSVGQVSLLDPKQFSTPLTTFWSFSVAEDYFLSEIPIFTFPPWPRVTSLFHSPSSVYTFPLHSSFRLAFVIPISPRFSLRLLLFNLDLMTLTQPYPGSPVSHIFQTESQPSVSLTVHIFSFSSKLLWSYYQNMKLLRGGIITKSCALVPTYSCADMISSLTWVSHTPCLISISLSHSASIPSLSLRLQGLALNLFPPSQKITMFTSQRPYRTHVAICPQFPILITISICVHPVLALHLSTNFLFPSQMPSVCLLTSLALYLFSPDCFKLVSIDYYYILHQTLTKKLCILYFI